MKRFFTIFFTVLLSATASAQLKTSYFMTGARMRMDMNPALAPRRGYVQIPVVGGMYFSKNSNFASIDNLLYPHNGGLVTFMHGSVDADKFLRRLSKNNYIDVDTKIDLASVGNHARRYFWNFDFGLRAIGGGNIPKDLFSFLKKTTSGTCDLGGMSFSTDMYLQLGLGFAFPIIENKVEFGFKVKALLGLAQFRTEFDRLYINSSADKLSGSVRGRLVGNINAVDPVALLRDKDVRFKGIGNFGGAIDVGVNVRLLDDHLRVSAAVVDLGFVKWSDKHSVRSNALNYDFEITGYDIDDDEFKVESTDDLDNIEWESGKGYARRLSTTLNIGAEYSIMKDRISFGLLSSTKFAPSYTTSEVTLSANFRPVEWFGCSLSNSFVNNKVGIFGFAFNFDASWINFFLGMDYVAFKYAKVYGYAVPLRGKSSNLYFGLAVPLRTHEKAVDSYRLKMARKARKAAR